MSLTWMWSDPGAVSFLRSERSRKEPGALCLGKQKPKRPAIRQTGSGGHRVVQGPQTTGDYSASGRKSQDEIPGWLVKLLPSMSSLPHAHTSQHYGTNSWEKKDLFASQLLRRQEARFKSWWSRFEGVHKCYSWVVSGLVLGLVK